MVGTLLERDTTRRCQSRELAAVACSSTIRATDKGPPGDCCFEMQVDRTHDFHPRFSSLSRLLKYLGGHLKSLKSFKIHDNVALKELASAVQLPPWPSNR